MESGRSVSYYYVIDNDQAFVKITAGRMSKENTWEFYMTEAYLPEGMKEEQVQTVLVTAVNEFLKNQAFPFFSGKLEPNAADMGVPV